MRGSRQELRLPAFQWYTPLWAATEAMLAGRYDDAERLVAEAEESGRRAGDRNAELFASMVRFNARIQREDFDETDLEFASRTRSPTQRQESPTAAHMPGSWPVSAKPSEPARSSGPR